MTERILKKIKAKDGQEVILRELKIGDVKDFTELYNSIVDENLTLDMPYTLAGKKQSLAETEEWLIKKLKNVKEGRAVHLAAEINGKIIAACEASKDKDLHEHRAEFGIIVHKDYRKLGIGKQMFEILMEEAKKIGVEIAIVGVYETNEHAISLYEKLGFKEFGKIPKGVKTKKGYIADVWMYKEL